MRLRISRQAAADIRAADAWWAANRPAVPEFFRAELRKAFEVLPVRPEIGAPALDRELQGVRRLLLRSTRYFVYYAVHEGNIEVLRLWQASRGRRPEL